MSFSTLVDLELEKNSLLAYYSEFIKAGRSIPRRVVFYRDKAPFLSVTPRSMNNPDNPNKDFHKSIAEALFLMPATTSELFMLCLADSVKFTDRISPSIILIAVNPGGAFSEVYPYEYNAETDEVIFDYESELDPNVSVYSDTIERMIQLFAKINDSVMPPSELIESLSDRGHEIHFHGDWTQTNIDPRCHR